MFPAQVGVGRHQGGVPRGGVHTPEEGACGVISSPPKEGERQVDRGGRGAGTALPLRPGLPPDPWPSVSHLSFLRTSAAPPVTQAVPSSRPCLRGRRVLSFQTSGCTWGHCVCALCAQMLG